MSEAWELARQCIGKAQKWQKDYSDRRERPPTSRLVSLGLKIILLQACIRQLRYGSWRGHTTGHIIIIVNLDPNMAHIHRVDRPEESAILVSLKHLRRCAPEVPYEFWPPDWQRARKQGRRIARQHTSSSTGERNTIVTERSTAVYNAAANPGQQRASTG